MADMTAAPRPMISATASTRRVSMTCPFRLGVVTRGYDGLANGKRQSQLAAVKAVVRWTAFMCADAASKTKIEMTNRETKTCLTALTDTTMA
jgi:hypothetical protein